MEAGGREGRSVHRKGVWPGVRKVIAVYSYIHDGYSKTTRNEESSRSSGQHN